MFEIDLILNAFFTLFVTIDPVGLAPIFIGITVGMSREERVSVAVRACIIAFFLLLLFLLAGQAVCRDLQQNGLGFVTLGAGGKIAVVGIRDCRHDADDYDNDHQFHEREAPFPRRRGRAVRQHLQCSVH